MTHNLEKSKVVFISPLGGITKQNFSPQMTQPSVTSYLCARMSLYSGNGPKCTPPTVHSCISPKLSPTNFVVNCLRFEPISLQDALQLSIQQVKKNVGDLDADIQRVERQIGQQHRIATLGSKVETVCLFILFYLSCLF